MSKYTVQVTVKAEVSYEVEVDADDESKAEQTAIGMWREKTPEDFQVEKGYVRFATEAEQTMATCPRCLTDHVVPHWALKVCHCGIFGTYPDKLADGSPRIGTNPHLAVDGRCAPAPWWIEDQDFCAACGVLEAAEYDAALVEAE